MKQTKRLSVWTLILLAAATFTFGCHGSDTADADAVARPPARPEPAYDWADPELPARLDAAMRAWAGDFGYFGGAVAVSTRGWLDWKASFGKADVEGDVPFRVDIPGRVGSTTKSFTATLIMQLIDEGRLSLSSTLGEFVPTYPNGRNITVEHLLRHRSGIPEIQLVDAYFIVSTLLFQDHWYTPEEILLWTFLPPPFPPIMDLYSGEEIPRAPVFEPGAGYHYSQPGYVALGLIAEKITGEPLADLIEDRICRPLGLTGTYMPRPDERVEYGGYTNIFGLLPAKVPETSVLFASTNSFHSASWAAGALLTTARDMTVFLSAMLEGRLFSQARLENATDWYGGGDNGMGLYRSRYDDFTTVGHNGSLPGGGSVCQYIQDLDVYVGAVRNTDSDWVSAPDLVERVRRALLDEPLSAD